MIPHHHSRTLRLFLVPKHIVRLLSGLLSSYNSELVLPIVTCYTTLQPTV